MNIVALSRDHDRNAFDCGDLSVNSFLKQSALQDQKLRLSGTSVLVDDDRDAKRIIGYHTLILTTVDQQAIPDDRPKIKRAIPAILLGQLGIDVDFQGQQFGNLLLSDVEFRVYELLRNVQVRTLVLDARNERLAKWYEKRGFVRFPDSLRMFKSVNDIVRLFEN